MFKRRVLAFVAAETLLIIAALAQGGYVGGGSTFKSLTVNGTATIKNLNINTGSGLSGYAAFIGGTSGSQGISVPMAAGSPILYLLPTSGTPSAYLQDSGVSACPNLPAGAPTTCHQLVWNTPAGGGGLTSGTVGGAGQSGYISYGGGTSGSAGFSAPMVAGTATLYLLPTSGVASGFLQDNGTATCPTLPGGAPTACRQLAWATPPKGGLLGGSGQSGYVSYQGGTSGSAGFSSPMVAGTATLYLLPTAGVTNGYLQDTGTATCPTLPGGAPSACRQLAWTTPAGGGSGGDIDLATGSKDGGGSYMVGVWKSGANGLAPLVYGGVSYHGPSTATSGDYLRADFRLPKTWTGGTTTVYVSTFDTDGNARTVTYTAQIGCTANGDNVFNTTEPTYGTAASLSGSQLANSLLEMSATLPLPTGCTTGGPNANGSLKVARLKLIRTGAWTGSHGLFNAHISW